MLNQLPRTHALLEKLRRSLRRSALRQELGMAAVFTGGWLGLMYAMDALLHLPGPLRLIHTIVLAALPVWFLMHRLRQHWSGIPDSAGLAVLAERGTGENQDLLVSAIQLAQDPAFIERGELQILERCEELASSLSLDPVLNPAPERKWMQGGLLTVAGLVAIYLGTSATADIFVARMFGAHVPWPQRTHLDIEIPGRADRMFVERTGDLIHVRVARGSDVPILVRAGGVVPEQVFLIFDHGHRSMLESGGSELFRSQLRSVQQDLVFHATGGDDGDHKPEVRIEVLDPPDITNLAFRITPPAYTGLPERLAFGTDVEVLAQSQIEVHLLPDPLDVVGMVHILPSGDVLELQSAPFPDTGEGEASQGLAFKWTAEDSLRFRLELKSPNGLLNPDPGLYAIQVREDARPVLSVLAPARVDLEVVSGGFLPLRVRAQDDFGMTPASYTLVPNGQDPMPTDSKTLPWSPIDLDSLTTGEAGLGHSLLAVDDLSPMQGVGVSEGQVFTLQFSVLDNREPKPQVSRSGPIRVRVLSGDDYLRKLETRLAQAGDKANRMAQLLEQTQSQMRNMQMGLGGDGSDGDVDLRDPLFDVQRLGGDSLELARDLASLCEGLLYSRLDSRAGPLMRAMDEKQARQAARNFNPAPWLDLIAAYDQGQLGQASLGADLLKLVGFSLEISEQHTAAMSEALKNGAGLPPAEALALAYAEGQAASAAIDKLLTRLGEWDNFQSMLTLTRDIIKRQRNVRERTRKYAEEK